MILIKSFLTGFFMIVSNLCTRILKKGIKVRECCSCLKMIVQTHLHVCFFTAFFIRRASLKLLYLYMKRLQSSTIFNQKYNHEMPCLKFLHENFYNPQFKKYNLTVRIVTIEKPELTFLLILYFHE